MDIITEFLVDPLVVPVYYYVLIGYCLVWSIAFILARLFMNDESGVESAVTKAWGIALSLHMIGGLFFITWIFIRAKNAVGDWLLIFPYLLLYIVFFLVDLGLLFSLFSKKPKKEKAAASVQTPPSKSRNPKNAQ